MILTSTKIKDVHVLQTEPRGDHRGHFKRLFCAEELKNAGIDFAIAQINSSFTKEVGTVRGMHYQLAPKAEGKIVRVLRGKIFDAALDLRENSLTYGQWFGIELSSENNTMLYVPKGFAHGFQTMMPDTEVEYFVSEFYSPDFERGVRWNDSKYAVNWPISEAILSEKDSQWPFH